MYALGSKIRRLRGKESRNAFAARFDIHPNTLSGWEADERLPDVGFIQKLMLEYKISPEWLLLDRESIDPPARISSKDEATVSLEEHRVATKLLWAQIRELVEENRKLQDEKNDLEEKLKKEYQLRPSRAKLPLMLSRDLSEKLMKAAFMQSRTKEDIMQEVLESYFAGLGE